MGVGSIIFIECVFFYLKPMKNLKLIMILLMAAGLFSSNHSPEKKFNLYVNPDVVIHKMRGGAGASWHSMIHDIPLENEKYDYPVRHINPRGSAFAGNPPLSDTAAWNQLYDHASWLGLNFLRVELSMHMYEPQRNAFDWENDEMQALYRILDWCESAGADVFLQQMWGHVAWNAFPGVHPLLSSPRSVDDFANGIAALLKHLTRTRNYTCIKYFCMVNEPPGGPWGYWWSSGSHEGPSITDAWRKLDETFKKEGIEVLISGPDWTSLPPVDPEKLKFEEHLGALDVHSYNGIHHNEQSVQTVADWVEFARLKKKPFFITEIGNMSLGWGTDNKGPKSFKAALSNASDVAVCLNLGVDGFNRWSFTNRGDMDGQWQLVKTYDIGTKTYTRNVTPEPEAYYGYAMVTRFMGKYASVLATRSNQDIDGVFYAAYKNGDGAIVILVVNNQAEPVDMDVQVEANSESQPFYLYQVTEKIVNEPGFKLDPVKRYKKATKLHSVQLAPESITILTNIGFTHAEQGMIR
jgi:hypothetical protein